jgi:hypothetical protein
MYGGPSKKLRGISNAVQGTQPGEDKVSMAEVKYSEKPGELISTFIWSGLHSGDRGEPIRNVSGNISFQIAGDFGVGGRAVIEVSKDATVYETANDRRRNPALATAPWLRTIPDNAAFVRPRVYGGDDATLVTVVAVFRRPPRSARYLLEPPRPATHGEN